MAMALFMLFAGTSMNATASEITADEASVLKVSHTSDGIVDLGRLVSKFIQKNKCSSVTVEFEAGQIYEINRFKIPQLESITLAGAADEKGNKTKLILSNVVFTSPIQSLSFNNVCIDGNATRFLLAWDGDMYAKSLAFVGCEVRNINQGIVRVGKDGAGMSIKDITFDDCILSEISTGGWGAINIGSDVISLERVAITNCTVLNIGDRFVDLRGGVGEVIVENCTFYNSAKAKRELGRVFQLRNTGKTPVSPQILTVRNVIFAGGNAGLPMNAGGSKYKCLDFSDNNYITSDLQEGNVPFNGITKLEIVSDKFFANPRKGDFHIKAKFTGRGKTGDPRWY